VSRIAYSGGAKSKRKATKSALADKYFTAGQV